MSDSPVATDKPLFTEKEEKVLRLAWYCIKDGPPEIDLAKLQEIGDFKTKKTCSNTWGIIKKKLASAVPAYVEDDAEDTPAPAATPAKKSGPKTRGGAKKATVEDASGDETELATPEPAPTTRGTSKKRKATTTPAAPSTKKSKKSKTTVTKQTKTKTKAADDKDNMSPDDKVIAARLSAAIEAVVSDVEDGEVIEEETETPNDDDKYDAVQPAAGEHVVASTEDRADFLY